MLKSRYTLMKKRYSALLHENKLLNAEIESILKSLDLLNQQDHGKDK